MTERTSAAAVAILLSSLSLAGSVGAFHADDLPVIDSSSGTGASWVAWQFTTEGAIVAGETVAATSSWPVSAGLILFDENDDWFYASSSVLDARGVREREISVRSAALDALGVSVDQGVDAGPSGTLGAGFSIVPAPNSPPQTFTALAWVGGDLGTWERTLRGGAEVSFDGVESGDDVHFLWGHDLSGVANARSTDEDGGVQAKLLTTASIEVDDTLFGMTLAPPEGAEVLTVRHPDGSIQLCRCTWAAVDGPDAAGAGTYAFDATSLGTGTFPDGYINVVDARLP